MEEIDFRSTNISNLLVNCKNLLECAEILSQFSEYAMQFPDKKRILIPFKQYLENMYHRLLMVEVRNNKGGYIYYSEGMAIGNYLILNVDLSLSPVKFIKSMKALSQMIFGNYEKASGRYISKEDIDSIMKYLNTKYHFSSQIFTENPGVFLELGVSHKIYNSHTVPSKDQNGNNIFWFLLYHSRADSESHPIYVFLHELGHAVQAEIGHFNSPPKSFFKVPINHLLHTMSLEEQCEVFADAFAIAVMHNPRNKKYLKYSSFNELSSEMKNDYVDYFDKLLVNTV